MQLYKSPYLRIRKYTSLLLGASGRLRVCASARLRACMSACLRVYASARLRVYASVRLRVRTFAHPQIRVFSRPRVHVFAHPPVCAQCACAFTHPRLKGSMRSRVHFTLPHLRLNTFAPPQLSSSEPLQLSVHTPLRFSAASPLRLWAYAPFVAMPIRPVGETCASLFLRLCTLALLTFFHSCLDPNNSTHLRANERISNSAEPRHYAISPLLLRIFVRKVLVFSYLRSYAHLRISTYVTSCFL